ncbi:MAG: 1-(5-phosphoribosyl)-5-[(5-phosphoribosylamino)methylideneamino]imidazole-4-carboxamide isomerase [Planctomycetaceae bacterium]|nr:1-(5-phosphoribosyl)-5-[(5-phosphoribosylamino)methylideneamino]imidazole-4-carboxamide isomerase [Planctomycetaceae bacterium]
MQLWPAIDLRDGRCVRLRQGDYQQETIFGDDPAAMARRWVDAGAEYLHLVDLDGARLGRPVNLDSLRAIRAAVDIPCELGGGIRDDDAVELLLELGIDRLVIGTQALKRPTWFRELCGRHPQKLALGLDARGGRVATEGWLETSETPATALAAQFNDEPLAAVIYTDIETDGMLAGPNLAALAEMQEAVTLPVIASGGVTTLDDVRRLARQGVAGCIIGRALYEGSLDLTEALAVSREPVGS